MAKPQIVNNETKGIVSAHTAMENAVYHLLPTVIAKIIGNNG